MKRRRIIIISFLFVMIFGLMTTSCTLGEDGSNCHGICSNSVFDLPYMMTNCLNGCLCSGCQFATYNEVALTEKDCTLDSVNICENSEGTGANGYLTVETKLSFNLPAEALYNFYYITYKVNVYDDGVLAGSAIVIIDKDEIIRLWDEYTGYHYSGVPGVLIKDYAFIDRINVKMDYFKNCNFTCEVEYIDGRYARK